MLKLPLTALAGLYMLLVIAIAGGGAWKAATRPAPPVGDFVTVDGRSMRVVCVGARSERPTILLTNGAFGYAGDWAEVQARLAREGLRSCAFDRAGQGFSEPSAARRDAEAIASDMEKALERLNEPGPYVLAGHSMAGILMRVQWGRMPDRVKGIVLVDAAHPEAVDSETAQRWLKAWSEASDLGAVLARLGVFTAVAPFIGDQIGLAPEASLEKKHVFASARHNAESAREVAQAFRSARQAVRYGMPPPEFPIAVVTAGPVDQGDDASYEASKAAFARRSKQGLYENVPDATHGSLLGIAHADRVVAAILHVTRAAEANS